MPNETWQSDFTDYRLTADADVEVHNWLHACTRNAVPVTAHRRGTNPFHCSPVPALHHRMLVATASQHLP